MTVAYEYLKEWRSKRRNKKYNSHYMQEKRAYYKDLYDRGLIKYKEIPKSYRYFAP